MYLRRWIRGVGLLQPFPWREALAPKKGLQSFVRGFAALNSWPPLSLYATTHCITHVYIISLPCPLSPFTRNQRRLFTIPSIVSNLLMNVGHSSSLDLSFPTCEMGRQRKVAQLRDSQSLRAIRNEGSLAGDLGGWNFISQRNTLREFSKFHMPRPQVQRLRHGVKCLLKTSHGSMVSSKPFSCLTILSLPGPSLCARVKHGGGS